MIEPSILIQNARNITPATRCNFMNNAIMNNVTVHNQCLIFNISKFLHWVFISNKIKVRFPVEVNLLLTVWVLPSK